MTAIGRRKINMKYSNVTYLTVKSLFYNGSAVQIRFKYSILCTRMLFADYINKGWRKSGFN